uniref:Uncharacterized protein n=1 Tax=Anguilla anguilla TaxID=7936 RepID=A0A0E9WG70_ANGAN
MSDAHFIVQNINMEGLECLFAELSITISQSHSEPTAISHLAAFKSSDICTLDTRVFSKKHQWPRTIAHYQIVTLVHITR